MKKDVNPFIVNDFQIEGMCRNDSFYVRFTDEDLEELAEYAQNMGYILESETAEALPVRFKITSGADASLFGWVSKVKQLCEGQWKDRFLYGFYRRGRFFAKYPIDFNIQSHQMRRRTMRKAELNPKMKEYFRTVFGIIDLEKPVQPLDFILSWLSGCKIQSI